MRYLARPLLLAGLASPLLLATAPASAQFGDVFGAIKNQVEQEVERQVRGTGGNTSGSQDSAAGGQRLQINEGFAFTPGSRTIVATNFADAPLGTMPDAWKTNGSGAVVSVGGIAGNWLKLQPFATYKLNESKALPESFTVEFDVLTAADTARDASGFYFGFARDNSVADYIMDAHNHGAIASVHVNYTGSSNVSSSATDYYHAERLDLRHYANQVMHVSIAVEGEMLRVYLDDQKIADTRAFTGQLPRYFFISAPTRTRNNAQLLFGNFRAAH
ncbi:hypothetical protein [Novosphingobium mangrovi (ex Hu et al. 2023)]|uniref:Uncharacterized protein n=1 Tax=Novosphingobium mangrovi (ex Hu et al. 2023) TaxID=2930094 RepID=A0ABT0A888_9SPHN|nr:hypothetical protein [Novosphingobium mangrovi (ex Hu et al. 2023)]MCJ1959424.1 hypothetical protein [Novosphingobium mangrovi (ex Hu et al. 2023)]